ncbi:MAG: discoidin domain-containing protein [Ruminococcaceae bacterium]|nr:discoidin domain-containing protein [Oscillospiraceae bacterium]
MKNTRRILAAVLTLVMIMSCFAAFTVVSAAEETEVNLGKKYAQSMMIVGRDIDGKDLFTDGNCDDYWTLNGRWTEDDVFDENDMQCGTPKPVEENPCYVEADLGAAYEITAISAAFILNRVYKWEAYVSNDNTLPIGEWTKVAEKTTNEVADGNGYKDTLETPVNARYVRLYGTYNSSNRSIHLCEFGIWGIDPNADETPDVLYPEKWVAPENGINIIAGNETCVIKADRGDLPEMTDGICGDMASDNYWTAGSGGADVPGSDPIANNSGAWFQVNLDEVSEIDAIRIATLVNEQAIYHWEIYATNDAEAALEDWTFVGEKKTDEVSTEDGYAIYLDKPIEAQYIRIYGTYCNLTGGNNRFRVTEIELWDIQGAGQTGDAAVYATIAVAISAVALVVVAKKRTTI